MTRRFICGRENVYGISESECMKHIVSNNEMLIYLKKYNYYCEEQPCCTRVVTEETLTDSICSTYSISKERYGTHTCMCKRFK